MSRPATTDIPVDVDENRLRRSAERVLLANWTGRWTVPSRELYPHQWSWDSAFIAIGLRHLSPRRAQQELESLLGAQWPDGRLPHIVFDPRTDPDAYFPGPDFWRTTGMPARTSGLVQPPVHAIAVWEVFAADPALARRRGFLARSYPKLVRWHEYLRVRRDLAGHGLAAIRHPWESGMDNSPAWDAPLLRVEPVDAGLFQRRDLRHAAAADRPTNVDYGRYVRLAADYRDSGYADDGGADFAVEDPMFNALLAASEAALAAIAGELGLPTGRHWENHESIRAALDERLFSPTDNSYLARDLSDDRHIPERTISGLVPLIVGGHPVELLETVGRRFGVGRVSMVPSYDLTADGFDGARYWRGPSWFNTAWLMLRGFRAVGALRQATGLRHSILLAATRSGFREYVDPYTTAGHGSDNFSWTAAAVLDLLRGTVPAPAASDPHGVQEPST